MKICNILLKDFLSPPAFFAFRIHHRDSPSFLHQPSVDVLFAQKAHCDHAAIAILGTLCASDVYLAKFFGKGQR